MEQQTDTFIPSGMNAFQRTVKRVGDCLIAFVALIVFSPLFLFCYLAVKREDGGPAIFKQERIGRFGRRSISTSSRACGWMRRSLVRPCMRVERIPD